MGGKKIRICILFNTSIVTTRVRLTLFLFWIILKPSTCLPLSTFGCPWWVCYDSNASYTFISRHLCGSLLQRLCDSSGKVLWQMRSKGMANSWTLGLALLKWEKGHERKKNTLPLPPRRWKPKWQKGQPLHGIHLISSTSRIGLCK